MNPWHFANWVRSVCCARPYLHLISIAFIWLVNFYVNAAAQYADCMYVIVPPGKCTCSFRYCVSKKQIYLHQYSTTTERQRETNSRFSPAKWSERGKADPYLFPFLTLSVDGFFYVRRQPTFVLGFLQFCRVSERVFWFTACTVVMSLCCPSCGGERLCEKHQTWLVVPKLLAQKSCGLRGS